MENMYFDLNDTLLEITNNHTEAIDLLSSIGFENIRDEKQRKAFGGSVTLETALRIKKINENTFVKQLVEAIENGIGESDGGLESNGVPKDADLRIVVSRKGAVDGDFSGLDEEKWRKHKKTVGYDLKAASKVRSVNSKATTMHINGLTGQGTYELSTLLYDEKEDIETIKGKELRFSMPSALCSYCLGEKRIGEDYQMGNIRKIKLNEGDD